ncbi:hypothetical protein QBC45DRAFT_340847 [Copromyces sp. CBS 386.78]|nr:hypothetical protein QBC45DRAFT_340847 [Copromyces sp. CBS 386.78]
MLGGHFKPSEDGYLDLQFRCFADASFADNIPSRRSTAGHVVFLTCGPVLWKSKRQEFVTTSTTEAEFTNLVPAARSLEWVGGILKDLGFPQNPINKEIDTNIILFTDSANARERVLNPNASARNRHIDVRYKWLIEQSDKKAIKVVHIPGDEMAADGLTKPLKADKHSRFVGLVGLVTKDIPWV